MSLGLGQFPALASTSPGGARAVPRTWSKNNAHRSRGGTTKLYYKLRTAVKFRAAPSEIPNGANSEGSHLITTQECHSSRLPIAPPPIRAHSSACGKTSSHYILALTKTRRVRHLQCLLLTGTRRNVQCHQRQAVDLFPASLPLLLRGDA